MTEIGLYAWYTIPEDPVATARLNGAWTDAGFDPSVLPDADAEPSISGNRARTMLWRYVEQLGAEPVRPGVYFLARRMTESGEDGRDVALRLYRALWTAFGEGSFHAVPAEATPFQLDYLRWCLPQNFTLAAERFARELRGELAALPKRKKAMRAERAEALMWSQVRLLRRAEKIRTVLDEAPDLNPQLRETSALLDELLAAAGMKA